MGERARAAEKSLGRRGEDLFGFPDGRSAFFRTHADLKLLEERGY
jgi:hypothetical protein